MKNQSILAVTFFCALSPIATWASSYIGTSHSATCRYPYPLSTYQGCNEYTHAGREAGDCALDQALSDCKDEHNSDCVEVGTTYREIISTEFIGYKACEATVRVHGYRLAD